MDNNDQSKIVPEYDWVALKIEFLAGNWNYVSDFIKEKNIQLPVRQLKKLVRGWIQEKKQINQKLVENASQAIVNMDQGGEAEKALKETVRLGKYLILKGEMALKMIDPTDVDEARKLIETGNQMVSNALGLDRRKGGEPSLTQVNVNLPKTKLDEILNNLDYEGILKLIAEVRRTRVAKSGTDTAVDSPKEIEP